MTRAFRTFATFCGAAVLCVSAGLSSAGPVLEEGAAAPKQRVSSNYLVRMSDNPVVAYKGGISGLKATAPKRGDKIDPNHPEVVRYATYLDSRHAAALASVGGGKKIYDYRYAVNGFAAELTADQAARLAKMPGVVSVEQDVAEAVDTLSTRDFLGLTAAGGLWSQLGGPAGAGEGVIIGVIDTGIWPEHPSVSDRTGENANGVDGKLDYQQIPGWHGKCVPGDAFNASHCNQKLIGCQFYADGFGAANRASDEYLSCRDSDSHGTHTATTAGGNHGVSASINGITLGTVSGMAPRARLSIYKTCWRAPGATATCFGSDRAAAIDQAVADGVDVLNHSIGATRTNFLDVVQVAFLFAADAGVFVAASGGNEGPTASTVASPGPWTTTVAASTHDRFFAGSGSLGSGFSFGGASLTDGTGSLPLVYAGSAPAAADPTPSDPTPFITRVQLCFLGHLDPAVVAGKMVLCDRGINARVDKSREVAQAGGAAMILRNLSANTLNADLHSVPSIHVDHVAGPVIKAYIDGTAGATAQLNKGVIGTTAAPFIAAFSSRGPIQATGGDLLKPDLTAPGVDVFAGVSPAAAGGAEFGFLSGTSMSSPHIAGLAALMKHRHPGWSPMMIKSAMMTTATQILGTGANASAFAQGAGHVNINAAVDPGLVYDSGFNDWVALICGAGQLTGCATSTDPSDFNQASIAIGDLAGSQTITRRVTNVGSAGTYTVAVSAPPGISVSVSPTSLTLATGQSASYSVSFTRTTAALNAYQFGSLTWSDGTHNVKSPLVIRPVALSAPASLALTGASGSTSFNVKFGFTGTYAVNSRGLTPATTTAGSVTDDPNDTFDPANPTAGQGFTAHTVNVPAGTIVARFALFDAFTDGNHDLDIWVANPAGVVQFVSAGATSAETVTVSSPAAGNWTVYVHGFATDGPDANYTLFNWNVGDNLGNTTVSFPSAATIGGTGTVNYGWSGLAAGTKYLGVLRHFEGATERVRTVVAVESP
ncbi:MAG: S8 family peptidase [Gammaproteobacteria bacterium]